MDVRNLARSASERCADIGRATKPLSTSLLLVAAVALAVTPLALSPALRAQSDGAKSTFDPEPVVSLLELVLDEDTGNVDSARQCLGVLTTKIQSREVTAEQLASLRKRLDELLAKPLAKKPPGPIQLDAAILAATWKNEAAIAIARALIADAKGDESQRLAAIGALVFAGESTAIDTATGLLADAKSGSPNFRGGVLAALGRSDNDQVAQRVLTIYSKLDADTQPKAIELLTQRTAWSKSLLDAIGKGQIASSALNVNQVRKLLASKDADLVKAVQSKWGNLRTDRDPRREQVIAEMRALLRKRPGDATRGHAVFHKLCGQCHKIHGQGSDVGPDITANGRASFEQLLSNVFDPSLVIGASYQAVQVRTTDGRVLTGLPVEDSPERLILKVQGGKQEIIPREEIDEQQVSKLSLMPEELEKQLKPEEIADLFAFLCLDKPPSDPGARRIPGTP